MKRGMREMVWRMRSERSAANAAVGSEAGMVGEGEWWDGTLVGVEGDGGCG